MRTYTVVLLLLLALTIALCSLIIWTYQPHEESVPKLIADQRQQPQNPVPKPQKVPTPDIVGRWEGTDSKGMPCGVEFGQQQGNIMGQITTPMLPNYQAGYIVDEMSIKIFPLGTAAPLNPCRIPPTLFGSHQTLIYITNATQNSLTLHGIRETSCFIHSPVTLKKVNQFSKAIKTPNQLLIGKWKTIDEKTNQAKLVTFEQNGTFTEETDSLQAPRKVTMKTKWSYHQMHLINWGTIQNHNIRSVGSPNHGIIKTHPEDTIEEKENTYRIFFNGPNELMIAPPVDLTYDKRKPVKYIRER